MIGAAAIAAAAAITATSLGAVAAAAKTPGHRYCFNGVCHRVMTLSETRAAIGRTIVVQASHYDSAANDPYNPSDITSSGERFRADRPDNAASPVLPDGTKVLVWYKPTHKALIVRINNAGPYYGRRMLDLSRSAARTLGFAGIGQVHMRILHAPSVAEATYRRGRRYASVPGYIGRFGSLDGAYADASVAVGLPAARTRVAAAPPSPVRKPATLVAEAAQPSDLGDVAGVGAATVLRLGVADAGDRQQDARRTRVVLASLGDERQLAAEQAARAAKVAAKRAAERTAERAARAERQRTERLAAAKSAEKAQAKTQAQRNAPKPGSQDEDDDPPAKKTVSAPSQAAPEVKPAPEPDMSWVKVALNNY